MSAPQANRLPVWVISYPDAQPYRLIWDLQNKLREYRLADRIPDVLLLLEHNPVVTLGCRGNEEGLLLPRRIFEQRGVEVVETDRGGDVTYHGPGQLVGYWVFDLRNLHQDVRRFVRDMEAALIRTLGHFGVEGERREGATGVWIRQSTAGKAKIASLGLHFRRWVSTHGFALNRATDLEPFGWIIPCGINGCSMTTMERMLGRPVRRDELERALLPEVELLFDREAHLLDPHELADIVSVLDRRRPASVPSRRPRLPEWMRVRLPGSEEFGRTRRILRRHRLHTVCESAGCPNIGECWSAGTATFMILGDVCTRGCAFCGVNGGDPCPLDPDEPERVAAAVSAMGLTYAVVTSVTRDDLPDGGAAIWADTIRAIRRASPDTGVEVLIPDLLGDVASLDQILAADPDVLGHNVETVPRLYPVARPQADYQRSLGVLRHAKNRGAVTKSSLMLGLGEEESEVLSVMDDLRATGCDLLTLGQYLQPTLGSLRVARFLLPEEFDRLAAAGLARGFVHVESGPLVRSSYHAERSFAERFFC